MEHAPSRKALQSFQGKSHVCNNELLNQMSSLTMIGCILVYKKAQIKQALPFRYSLVPVSFGKTGNALLVFPPH